MEQRYYKDGIEVTVGQQQQNQGYQAARGSYPNQGGYAPQGAGYGGQQPPRPPYMYSYGGGGPVPPKKSHKGLIIFLVILAVIVALFAGCVAFAKNISSNLNVRFFGGSKEEEYLPDEDYIAVMYVEGEITDSGENASYFGYAEGYDHRWTLDKIDSIIEDESNKGLVLFLNTPGGGVYESDELYLKLKEYQSETKRPFYAVMGDSCTSGGVYVSASADKIYANRNCWTGSIGVTTGTILDVSELLERYGVKTTTIASGKNKSMGSMYEEMTEEQKEILQGLVDEAYDQFVGIVSEGRGIELSRTYELADGRLYSAKQAKELGLIDELGSIDDAIDAMKEAYSLECEAYDITPDTSPNYFNEFFSLISNIRSSSSVSDIQAVENIMKMAEKPIRPMYLAH